MGTTEELIAEDLRYLQLLSKSFPTIADASREIINLEAILNLPKGTEHFLTDIHGEYAAFQHVLKNGFIIRKIQDSCDCTHVTSLSFLLSISYAKKNMHVHESH